MIVQTNDKGVIRSILEHPWIYARISEDNANLNAIPDGPIYLTTKDRIGLFIAHSVNGVTMECHVQVIPDFKKQAHAFGQAAINWMWANTECQKLVAQIPTIYDDVFQFALSKGFEVEGLNKQSILKSGKLTDQYYMGLSKWAS